jgi:DNA-binding HxlR family transcriptional regulator
MTGSFPAVRKLGSHDELCPDARSSSSELSHLYARCMDESTWDRSRCSIAGALSVVGEKWSLLVLREAFLGVRRFADFHRTLGAPRAVLTDRLGTLVEQGLLTRVPYQAEGERQRHEYRLTAKGRDLWPVLTTMREWGDRWEAPDGAPLELVHDGCGEVMVLNHTCSACGETVDGRSVRARPGPGADPTSLSGTPLVADLVT